MSNTVIAVYPGTFDPITLGHLDLIRRGAALFGSVIVAVAAAHHKKTLFSLDERLDTVRDVVKDLDNVQVASFTGLVRDFAVAHGAKVMLRGVRSVTDFDFENQLAGMNRALAPDVDTVFLTPDARYQYISS
ncbi:MAG: pantetheine-phosphate adenylyltransferase, partial [Rhodoferax sp.]|nr:pantetheine-phosphate adenylyltransferase [Rhodoferax sp.]